jgi:hypothetical protein
MVSPRAGRHKMPDYRDVTVDNTYDELKYKDLDKWLTSQLKDALDAPGMQAHWNMKEFATLLNTLIVSDAIPKDGTQKAHHVTQALALLLTKTGIQGTGVDENGKAIVIFAPNPNATTINTGIFEYWKGPEVSATPGMSSGTQRDIQKKLRNEILYSRPHGITEIPSDAGQTELLNTINESYNLYRQQIGQEASRIRESRIPANALKLDPFIFKKALAQIGLSMSDYTLEARNTLIREGIAMFRDLHDEARIATMNIPPGEIPLASPSIETFIKDILTDPSKPEIREAWLQIVSNELGTEHNLTEEDIAAGKIAEGYPVTHPITGETTFHDKTTAKELQREYDILLRKQEDQEKDIRDEEVEKRRAMASIPDKERLYLALKDTPLFTEKSEKYIRKWIERKGPGIFREYNKQISEEISEGADPITEITTLEAFIGTGEAYNDVIPPKTYTNPAGVIMDYATDQPAGLLSFSERHDPMKDIFSPAALNKALAEIEYSEDASEMDAALALFRRKEASTLEYQNKFLAKQRKDQTEFLESGLISKAIEGKYEEKLAAQKFAGIGLTVPGQSIGVPTWTDPRVVKPGKFGGGLVEPEVLEKQEKQEQVAADLAKGKYSMGGLSTASLQELGRVDTLATYMAKDAAASKERFFMTPEGKQYAVKEKKRKATLAQEKSQKTRRGRSTMGGIQPAPQWLLGRV